ncbi:PREDICTED: LOW QUALITY PROTEIN: centrosomal protein of 290 kDa-like [Nicrophorus vespilloides]|uniref:LOW QUALITY PROTEIN: centrosomal protein of 290 kDa-like n=1 Tax=Nicrophorus vespilloides TaxID=110193 RepID=A0ABM1M4A8_NICVS|nr:PREDICTED: LOW QUALITY PROTEIN: centrosomal protein of 290 kDa-like [Nicrophorus vespilloides]
MDWKYLLSLNPEDIQDDAKDELLATIAWYDCDDGLDRAKAVALLKISQEIMKFKAEQVEALLAELDEIATKQGEEELRKDSDHERSSKSKRSLDIDDLEIKYRSVKAKCKKLQRISEEASAKCEKLERNVKILEEERVHLQNELQYSQRDESGSDISEVIKDQHKDLIENVHQKNGQISQLLMDIETVEADNLVLRTKLSAVRDELSDATENLEKEVENGRINGVKLKDIRFAIFILFTEYFLFYYYLESLESIDKENESLKLQVQDIVEDRKIREEEFEKFTQEIDKRIVNWKNIIDEKNAEIEMLRKLNQQEKTKAVSSDESVAEDRDQIQALSKVLGERERKIKDLQNQLETATKEMLETTEAIENIGKERTGHVRSLEKMNAFNKELKKQLKTTHNRCQELQEEVKYQENLAEMRDMDLKEFIDQLNSSELKANLLLVEELKTQKRFKERQISDLVRTNEKMQTNLDNLEKENSAMREKLGLKEDDFISTKSSAQRKLRKDYEDLQKDIGGLEEERIEMRLEIQKLSKIIGALSDQILDLGETPIVEKIVDESEVEEVAVEKPIPNRVEIDDGVKKEKYVAVVEENEALRKGLHEILESVQSEKGLFFREIKSETLEKLLLALDVKHITGWYHPAMRLQAELHNAQGINAELREQLRIKREELQNFREQQEQSRIKFEEALAHTKTSLNIDESTNNAAVIERLNKNLLSVLENYEVEEDAGAELVERLERYKVDFAIIQEQVSLLYKQYTEEKKQWSDSLKDGDKLREDYELMQEKLNMIAFLQDPRNDDEARAKRTVQMSSDLITLNRKCVYWENQEKVYKSQIDALKLEMLECEKATLCKLNKLHGENRSLLSRFDDDSDYSTVDTTELVKMRNDRDNLLAKERQLLFALDDIRKVNADEIRLLQEKVTKLESEKDEMQQRQLKKLSSAYGNEDLGRRLAQSEINEIAERQRADHTNHLFELVKEQLQKSEDRCREYQKYNNEIMRKNLTLQESLNDAQNKVIDSIELEVHKELQLRYKRLCEEKEQLERIKVELENELTVTKKDYEAKKTWSQIGQYELLALKHQIVDLQSECDDKSVIARLSSDVVLARIAQTEISKKLQDGLKMLAQAEDDAERCKNLLIIEREKFETQRRSSEKKLRNLEAIVYQQRSYYHGHVPLISEQKFAENVMEMYGNKKISRENIFKTEERLNELETIKDGLMMKNSIVDELKSLLDSGKDEKAQVIESWYQDKSNLLIEELKIRRRLEFKEMQLGRVSKQVEEQEEQIAKLECELLQSLCIRDINDTKKVPRKLETVETTVMEIVDNSVERFESATQTVDLIDKKSEELSSKEEALKHLKVRIVELELSLSLCQQQLTDKQSQISFYEKHIMDMQQKKETSSSADPKKKIEELKIELKKKDEAIIEYQSLLKKDRDEHSLAAARFQEELKQLQTNLLSVQHSKKTETKPEVEIPGRAAIEQYIIQVHALEKHTAELHTNVTSLKSQLQASRQEAVRWRSLATERLEEMDNLRIKLEEQHQSEIQAYKEDTEKWRDEVKNMQVFLGKYRKDIASLRPDIEKELKDKENKIHELSVTIRQLRRIKNKPEASSSGRDDNFEDVKENLVREHDVLKKRFEQLMHREKSAREEIRSLKGQLMKRPILSARSDTSSAKEHQLKKIGMLEKEVEELKDKLEREAALNEAHKVKVNEDFEKWSKQKYWQQTAEKLKVKLKDKSDDYDKLQQTCSGYRILIERLERDKHNVEMRLKNLKTNTANFNVVQNDALEMDNQRLQSEISGLKTKLEMQQHHSGALGAAMLQEKLEAQERKIAILEMSAKGGCELRAELERSQTTNSNLQKGNLRLEADNLELRLDLEKCGKELPLLREQILHLENYAGVLKSEQHQVTNSGDHAPDSRRIPEMERTIFLLKRIVEKLQAENKRLLAISDSAVKMRPEVGGGGDADHQRRLEDELRHKDELLARVKVLLQKAAAKEKDLLEQVTSLKSLIPLEVKESSSL